jgi:hypothetical protein
MQNSTIAKVMIALALVVLFIGVVMRFSGLDSKKAATTTANPNPQESVASGKFSHWHAMPAPEMEASERMDDEEAELPKLPREKIEEYLTRNNRSAASLIAAFHASDDTNYLYEAAANFPKNPQLQWTILTRHVFPEARRKWLDLFKTSSPDNAVAKYLSAADYFNSAQSELAIKELLEASGKRQFKDYGLEGKLDEQELSRAAGRTPLESMSVAGSDADRSGELVTFKMLVNSIGDTREHYLNAGDSASANNLVQMQLALADRLTTGEGGRLVINQLVGHAIEAMTVQQLEQNTRYDFLGGRTPTERLVELKQERVSLKELWKDLPVVYGNMTEAEILGLSDRIKTYGEVEALRWVQQRFGTNSPEENR